MGWRRSGGGAVYECISLHEILIPPVVKVIKDFAFVRCYQLTSVIVGEDLKEIGTGAFCGCRILLVQVHSCVAQS